jgi:hypothetical protein
MFYDWFDGPVGRHNDQYFLNESGVNDTMRNIQLNNLIQHWVYTDKGYTNDTHILTNAHTCLYQSQTGLYFDCSAPNLEEYFD